MFLTGLAVGSTYGFAVARDLNSATICLAVAVFFATLTITTVINNSKKEIIAHIDSLKNN